ncbi:MULTISPECIES: hypothetical protein [Bacillus cereus group]|uniref:hypothetical protein n=1 Tax=Bacillus cereus group TaxID=86661 RepID=UPI001F579716|nr:MULTISPECIES: hypothetical protein [unclassified Bacillus cereus group]
MRNFNFEIQLENYIITDLNYKFDENILPFLANKLSKENKDINEFDLVTQVNDQNSIKIAIHKDLKEMFIIMDTRVREIIDLTEYPYQDYFDDEEIILKSVDVSMKFNFTLETEKEFPSNLSDNERFMNEFQIHLEKVIMEICRYHMINIVRNMTALDYNQPIRLEFPKVKIENIEIHN